VSDGDLATSRASALVAPVPTRCARPTVGGKLSTYTVLGFVGYGVATAVGAALAIAWQLPLADRLIAMLVPPLAFLLVVTVARRIVGEERIVFYQVATAAVVTVAIVGGLASSHAARLVDIATVGIGVFLVFGRAGCFSVACCHGRLARFGVVYGPDHVRVGLWSRLAGRRLWPVQLVEGGASAALVVVALVIGWDAPGVPASVYILGYGLVRFVLELVRGDAKRPYALGLSEAQWFAIATLLACAVWRPSIYSISAAGILVVAAVLLVVTRAGRALFQPAHVYELHRACLRALDDGARQHTSAGVAASCHELPDRRLDCVLSADDPRWSVAVADRLAKLLWRSPEVIGGRLEGVVHVIVRRDEWS
jgi:hypothetical protein